MARAASDNGRIYGGESAEVRQARQRRQFMDAGLELFGTVGYRATTVRMLCRQAGLIDRYFYKNFTDIEDLLAAIYSESLDAIDAAVTQAVQRALASGNTEAMLTAGLDAFFRAFENPQVARVCWLEVLGVSPRIDALYTQRIQQFAELMVSLTRVVLPDLKLRKDELQFTGIALIGAISQSAMHWLLSDYRAPRRTLIAVNARLLRGAVEQLRTESATR